MLCAEHRNTLIPFISSTEQELAGHRGGIGCGVNPAPGAAFQASHIKRTRRKVIWEALHPVEQGGKTVSTLGGEQKVGFAADTAVAAGMTKQAINQHVARADALGDDLGRVAGTSLDKGVELDAAKLAAMG